MSIYLNKEKRIIVQGITGRVGSVQTKLSLLYGTNIIGGVSPGKGGEQICGVPIYNKVAEAVTEQRADASLIFVPADYAPQAVHAALNEGITLIVIITEHIPLKETLMIKAHARELGATVIGPNCPGILAPGIGRMGIIPAEIVTPGHIGVISRSGTLAFELVYNLTAAGIGQSTIVGIGGDPDPCISFSEVLSSFENDPDTNGVVLIGEVGGSSEERAADYIRKFMKKPVFAYITGRTVPPGKKMGHAGAIIRGFEGTVESKVTALKNAGVYVVHSPMEILEMISKKLKLR